MSAVVSSAYKMKNCMPISYFLLAVNFEDTAEVVLVDSLVNMSSHHKDPHEKKDTPSESSESHSDSEAEENLEQSKRGKRETKDDRSESKPLDSPNQVGTLTSKDDPFNEPIAGPSGLQEPRLESSDPEFKVESLSDPRKEKSLEEKDIDENIEARMVEDSDSTSSTSLFILPSIGETSSMLKEKSSVDESSRLRGEVDYPKHPTDGASIYMTESSLSSSSRRFLYVRDSTNTSWDISEIRSEIADISTEGSALQSSSESIEPKSSSSGESHSKECPDIKSSSEVQECSNSQKERKSWQKSGLLPSMQLPAMSSKDSVIAEEEDRTSRLREQDTEFMATKDPTPEKIEATPGKQAAEETEPSESKPAIESSDLVGGSEAGGTLKEHEQSSEVSELEQSVRKSKREAKQSSSTSSDEEQSSSSPKASTSRPKKRARYDKMSRTRHDSGGSVPKSVSPEQSEPKSTHDSSDYTPSSSSSETAL
ncbi:hypothetical protein AVEN_243237-1 [Araneus ventricosus]|uniref:Uncharacterized protein n=1 Tax=Araneus ventricosus TaxID=182803 RepID=A0A4Y2T7W3_ARAVE|nr:hypothetical protein AVEN_243237-1 [Araneus ventricosus]